MKRSRKIIEFPIPPDYETTPYALNEFTPSARTLSDVNSQIDAVPSRGSQVPVRMAKAVFVGDVGVGKTSIINRFCRDVFEDNYKATVGVDYEMERFWILNVPFNLQIWDTAGQERFKCIAASYYRGSHVVVTVFDASDLESLSTCQRWMDDVVNANTIPPLKFLVATKMDLVPETHQEKIYTMGSRMAQLLGAEYWPISSKTGDNVEKFFKRVATLAFETGLASDSVESFARQQQSLLRRESSGPSRSIFLRKRQSSSSTADGPETTANNGRSCPSRSCKSQ